MTTYTEISVYHPETERRVVAIRLTPEQAKALEAIVPPGPGEHPLTGVFVAEVQE